MTIAAVLALVGALAIGVGTAFADAGNPILGTIKASATDGGSTVTISVRGQWDWISHSSDCNFDRAATGVGIAWQDLNGPAGTTSRGNNEVQTFTIIGGPTGGTYRLKFDGTQTANIPYNAEAAAVQTALRAISTINGPNVNVTGGPTGVAAGSAMPNTPFTVTFVNGLGLADVPQMQLGNKSFTGGSGTNVTFATTTAGAFPVYNGYLVDNGPIRAYIGTSTATAGAAANPADRMVHPVDRGNVPEGYTSGSWRSTAQGYATNNLVSGYPEGQQFVDPPATAAPGAAEVAAWKGGCGREQLTDIASMGTHAEKTGRNCGTDPASTTCSTHPWGSWGYEKTYSHTYLKTLPSNVAGGGSGLPDRICVNFYDVHGGGKFNSGKFQLVNAAKEITVDLAGDNSIDTNAFNVNNGANCITVSTTGIVTEASSGEVGDNIHDKATISGSNLTTGTIHFELFGPFAFGTTPTSSTCTAAKRVFTSDVSTNGTSGNPYSSGNYQTAAAGLYFWTAHYTDASPLVLEADSACGASPSETSNVAKKSPGMLTDAGSPHTRTLPMSGGLDLSDTATITGSFPTPGGIGSISFELWRGATATACTTKVATVGIAGGASAAEGSNTSATVNVTQTGFYNWVAIYSGDDNNNGKTHPATCGSDANERVRIVNPGIMIDKSVNFTRVREGTEVTYTIKVSNTGDDDLTGVMVSDSKFPACDKNIGNLAAHTDTTYTCKVTLTDADADAGFDVNNTATATGTEPDSGTVVMDDDDATVHIIHPSIAIEKTACRTGGTSAFPFTGRECADPLTVHVGDEVTYHIKVTNTGDDDLTAVVVSDPTRPECDKTIGSLPHTAPDNVYEYDCTPIIAGQTVPDNTATATGTDSGPTPNTVMDDDDASVDVIHPAIHVTKALAPGQTDMPLVGTTVTFRITVENTGDVALDNIEVTDANAPGCARNPLGSDLDGKGPAITLNPTESKSYDCELADVPITFSTNLAEACADDPIDGRVCDDDTTTIDPQKRTPPVDTQASASIVVGGGRTIHDTATLGECSDPNAALCGYNPQGTITFELYGPDDANCSGPNLVLGDSSFTVTVNGNGPYDSPNFTPTTAGTYRWIANYSGDLNNNGTTNGCNGANEDVIVQPADSTVTTEQSLLPNDKARVTGASFQPTGDVTFLLFDEPTCTGFSVYNETVALSPGSGLTAVASTSNTGSFIGGFVAQGTGTWYWQVSYPGDDNNNPSESACGVETFSIDDDTTQ